MTVIKVADYLAHRESIHRIRYEVFVQEQNIPSELELDHWDSLSIHVLAWSGQVPVGTGRLLPDGHIGRVAVCRSMRNQGIGRLMLEKLFQLAIEQGHAQVEISAQCHAVNFYQKLGFREEGRVYLEAGIKHIKMVKLLLAPARAPQSPSVARKLFYPAAQANLCGNV